MIRQLAIVALLLCGSAVLAEDVPKLHSPELDALPLPAERSIEEIAKELGLEVKPGKAPGKAGSYRAKEIPDLPVKPAGDEGRG